MNDEPGGNLPFLTTADVATKLHVSAATVHNYIKRGWLKPAFHIGRNALFHPSAVTDLIRFLQRSATGTGS